jgi:XTP/dITP diphosphohydrolase
MARRLPREARLCVATHNAGKAEEIAALFAPYVAALLSAAALEVPEPEEIGATFADTARDKAAHAAQVAGLPAVADDSGLVVAALGGAPGVRSARWGGPEKDFAVAMRAVHAALGDAPREAAMITALALAWPDGHAEVFEGRVDGILIWPPRGALGVGYEPMFVPAGATRTYGETPRAEKHQDDPRARAFEPLARECLRSLSRSRP